ncbi:MAG: polymer-forming cytoskeletal protein [Nitrospira sp.]|nr:polymer-forming cytoskeletal protein [Nitrospira sp.]
MWKPDKQDGVRAVYDESEGGAVMSSVSSKMEATPDVSAFIGKGVDFKGTIIYNGTVRIDGSLEGEVQTDGVLLIGEEAVLKAKVTAGTVVCKGKITGDVTATEKIRLRAPAVLNGGVKAPMLSIEEGVLFNGTIEMTHSS